MPKSTRSGPSLLSELPEHLSKDLFASAKPVRVAADEVLFLAGDKGDGCYRIEEGLLKVTMVSRAGNETHSPSSIRSSTNRWSRCWRRDCARPTW